MTLTLTFVNELFGFFYSTVIPNLFYGRDSYVNYAFCREFFAYLLTFVSVYFIIKVIVRVFAYVWSIFNR